MLIATPKYGSAEGEALCRSSGCPRKTPFTPFAAAGGEL